MPQRGKAAAEAKPALTQRRRDSQRGKAPAETAEYAKYAEVGT